MKKTQILSIAAALLAAPALNAQMVAYEGFHTSFDKTPWYTLSVSGRVYPTSGGVQLSSWWTNPMARYYIQVTVAGVTNGVTFSRTWRGIPETPTQSVTVPISVIYNKPNNHVRQYVWYWAPNVVPNATNFLYKTVCEVRGDFK
ncbi:MAG: hypothetical protein E6R03_07565 [Hyphomicrobiaceae bacterium]|nr:MAG: hypothetical protein E6R03_07565 [Hyphomicrobiaceae bacterium]